MSELMTYKMEPAGHEEQQPIRKYAEPDKRFARIFEKWLAGYKYAADQFEHARKLIKGSDVTVEQVHALILKYQDNPRIDHAGEFVSAVYNQIPETEIIFDVDIDTPIKNIGYKLKKNKALINYSKLGDGFGEYAEGRLVNYGTTTSAGDNLAGLIINLGKNNSLGDRAEGIVINFGDTGDMFANDTTGARRYENGHTCICINYGKAGKLAGKGAECSLLLFAKDPESYSTNINATLLIKEQESHLPPLRKYLKEMKKSLEQGRHNPQKAIEIARTLTCKGIESKIKGILKREHYVWE